MWTRSVPTSDSHEFAELLVEAAPDALIVVDDQGRIVSANARTDALFGYARAELVGQSVELLVPEATRAAHRGLRAEFARQRAVRPMASGQDLQARRKDGTGLSIQIALSPIKLRGGDYVVAAVRETSPAMHELRRTQIRLQEAVGDLERVLEALPDAVGVRVGESYAYVNPAFVRLLGYASASDIVGRSVVDSVHPDDRSRLRERMDVLDREGTAPKLSGLRVLARDGTAIPLEMAPGVRVNYAGVKACLVVLHDVRERQRLEAALHARDRIVTVGTLAAGVAHEINNPLLLVGESLERVRDELLASDGVLPGERRQALLLAVHEAREGAERIRKIVRSLHSFARGEREEQTEVDVCSALDTALALTRSELSRHAEIVKDMRPVPPVLIDQARIEQVFINLLLNASQALASRPRAENRVQVSTWTEQTSCAVVEVRDNGPGMTAAVRTRIFEPFFTTKPVGEGTGLGLSIAYNIVMAAGGRMTCESSPERGATFRIFLPPAKPRESAPPSAPAVGGSRRGKVLVIDDEPMVASAIERMLRSQHVVEKVLDGASALALVRGGSDYDVILCDLMMPHMTGMELFQQVCAERPELAERFVFVTGGATYPEVDAFLASVRNPCCAKPFSTSTLRAVVRDRIDSLTSAPSLEPAEPSS